MFILEQDFCGCLSENPPVLLFLLSKVYHYRNKLVILLRLNDLNRCLYNLLFFFAACYIYGLIYNLP